MEEGANENDMQDLPSQELLRMSLKTPMTKIKKVKMKKYSPKLGLLRCDVCNKICNDKAALVSHKAVHIETAEFACSKCPYKGKTRKYLARHLSKVHTEPTKYKCDDCGKKFHFLNRLESHRRVHTGEKPYECKHCEKTFSARYSLNTHLLVHSDEKPFKCSFCEYACRDSSTLRKHQHRHMGLETVYQCKKCDMSFKKKYILKNHVAEAHLNMTLKRYKCDRCEKDFKRKALLTLHIKSVHDKSMRTECKICGVVINNRYNLTRHALIHTEARPYKCDFDGCDKRFKDPSSVAKHNIIHYPSKHMPCKICGKLFTRVRRLEYHMTLHKGRKRTARCEECGVCFYNEVYLRLHYQKKHDKKRKRYKCDLCDFFTSNKPSIVMHLKYGHAKDNDVECKICNIRFKKQEYLKMHFTRKHKTRYKPMKREKKKPKKPQIIIKEEPDDSVDDTDIMELLTNVKQEAEEQEVEEQRTEDTEDADGILYSDAVFSEDIAESYIKHNSEKLTKLPEDVFDTFFIEHVYKRYLEREEKPTTTDKEEVQRGIRRYKELLSEIIGGTEADIPQSTGAKGTEDAPVQKAKIKLKKRKAKEVKAKRGGKRLKATSGNKDGPNISDTERTTEIHENSEERSKINRITFNMHQCYVCFQVFETKKLLTKHCAQHFDVCSETQLKKCPLCTFVTRSSNFALHMRKVHKMSISYNYGQIQENVNGTKYSFKGNNGYDVEIIPSIKNLNKRECMKLDKRNRYIKEKSITKTKLVKLGNEWVVQKDSVPTKEFVKPNLKEFVKPDLKECANYLELLRQKYREYKSIGQRMLFPCQFCDKPCQSFSALKLHLRKHEKNPKPFKKKVWKHKLNNLAAISHSNNGSKRNDFSVFNESNNLNITAKVNSKDRFIRKSKVNDVLIDGKCLKIILKDCMKKNLTTQKNTELKAKNSLYLQKNPEPVQNSLQKNSEPVVPNSLQKYPEPVVSNYLQKGIKITKRPRSKETRDPLADPKPVTSKHKCDKALIEFYKNNIKGSDIEFWQFLKIFNKMTRENVEDFEDLESRYDFGMHIDNRLKNNSENSQENSTN
ncbi:hypothetical protein K1T71_000583 [Dendrolimus kikuchii]|uniref:Uncharacterized protein n=1 Tax=Dendrolimus kikuchii TaxID=765133 RepID=A0ACC1DJV2_9NEOP|nr:hypothetical protein K1T71_000583 [Dendrolimus kikuchii]